MRGFFINRRIHIIFLGLLLACANVKPPSGGEPDRTPPKIVEFSPANFTTNFNENEIYIKFSKWMERGSVVNSIFLNPPLKYEIKWSGKKMYIRFPEKLPENTTFNLVLGTNSADLDGNKFEQPFTLVFSTGTKIDSGRIVGKTVLGKLQNVYVYAIPVKELADTSFDINKVFHYRTQPDKDGIFSFEALKYDSYIVVAYCDKNNNKQFDFGTEDFGINADTILVSKTVTDTISILLAKPTDENSPIITNAFAVNQHTIKITFSEPIKVTDTFIDKLFEIQDTTSKKKNFPFAWTFDPSNPKEISIFFKDTLSLSVFHLSITDTKLITDTVGNPLKIETSILLKGSKNPDGNKPAPLQTQLFLKSPKDTFSIMFSKPLDTNKTRFSIKCINIEQNDTTLATHHFSNFNKIQILIPNLRWKGFYNILVETDTLFDFWGKAYYKNKFQVQLKVNDEPKLGSLKGKLIAGLDTSLGLPMIMAMSEQGTYYCKVVDNDFELKNILEGDYILVAFYDQNQDGIYNYGRLNPIKFSEKIIKISGKISIRRGWTVEELRF
ncbi:MAG: hypothetical protein CH6_3225 [Candidatus Kapaibacterium sp.]|nr:MAG: hypothetical protein CH6_3225 [Candidatus Kapabacteria bacterium]